MIKLFAVAAIVATATSVAAQPHELPLAAFLEKRVPDELAAEGKILSRENLALKVDQAGPFLIVSLVDLDTNRAAASTKLDQTPDDREAAVAMVTHVAADLLAQVAGRPKISQDTRTKLEEQERQAELARKAEADRRAKQAAAEAREAARKAAEQNAVATEKYHQEMIRFVPAYSLYVSNNSIPKARDWETFRGGIKQKLEPQDFYKLVGRPELAQSYDTRKVIGGVSIVVGVAATVGAVALIANVPNKDCEFGDPSYAQCESDKVSTATSYGLGEIGLGVLATGGLVLGYWYLSHPQPVTVDEAKSMAELYNHGIRQKFGVTAMHRSPIRDVQISPFVARAEGGVSVGGRF